jgi:hypothetical protein
MSKKVSFTLLVFFGIFYFISDFKVMAQSQNDSSGFSFDVNVDFVSRYIWRGQKLSETPAVQPGMSVSYKNFTLGTWSSFSFGNEPVQEIDLFLSYNTGYLTLTINDYFFPKNALSEYADYFDWNKNTTQHWLEGIVEISGIENLPLNFLAGVFFLGADIDADANFQYSTYIELSYDFRIKDTELNLFSGITPFEGYYSDGFDFVNVGINATKKIKITQNFSLPVSAAFIINPANKNVMFQALISI